MTSDQDPPSTNGHGDRLDRIEAALAALADHALASSARLDQLGEYVADHALASSARLDQLGEYVAETGSEVRLLMRAVAAHQERIEQHDERFDAWLVEMRDMKADIQRLYREWPEHLRGGHGDDGEDGEPA